MAADTWTSGSDAPGSIAEAILSALGDENRDTRSAAIAQAARDGDPEVLVDAVGDDANSLRRNAAIAALTKAGMRGVPALVKALDHEDPEVVMFAAGVLGKTRDRTVVPQLLRLLSRDDINVVSAAVEGLGRLKAAAAVDPLIELLQRDPWLRFAVVHALGEIADPRATDALVALLGDPMVGDMALEALGKIGTVDAIGHIAERLLAADDGPSFAVCLLSLADALEAQPDETAFNALPAWKRLRASTASDLHMRLLRVLATDADYVDATTDTLQLKAAVATVVRALRLQPLYTPLVLAGRSPQLREAVQFSAVSIGDEIAGSLAVGLAYENSSVRVLACHCVGALRLHQLAPRVEELLDQPDAYVRETAIQTLARLGHNGALPRIVALLETASPTVRDAAQHALGHMDAAPVSEALLERAALPRHLTGDLLARWLDVMKVNPHPSQRPFIEARLTHAEGAVRRAAVAALAAQGEFDVVGLLSPLLQDPEPDVRREVISVLARRRSAESRSILLAQLDRDPDMLTHTVRALADLNDATIAPHLIERFHDEGPNARLAIIEALSELEDPAAEPLLVRLLADPDEEIRRTAVKGLARFGSPTAMRHIVAMARDAAWQVRAMVAEVLSGRDDDLSLAALERLSLDRNHVVASIARVRFEALGADS